MKLLVIAPHFTPDTAPTGEVLASIVDGLVRRGHSLHIVTSLPWYSNHAIEPGWEGRLVRTEPTEWGAVTRLYPFPTDKTNIPARALAFGGFTAMALLRSLAIRVRPDAVLAMSPPLPLGVPALAVARTRRIPFVFNIQDVFPDVAVETGTITNPQAIAVASALERFLYRQADAVTVLSEDLQRNVATKIGPDGGAKVVVIPNFVDTRRIRAAGRGDAYRAEFGLGDRTTVMYAGNVGFSQPVDHLVQVARRLRDRRDVVVVVNGGGSSLADVRDIASDLDNVVFAPFQPRERLPEVLAAGDIHTILLKPGLARSSVPSKMYSILAAARPIVAEVDPNTEVTRTIEVAGAGLSVRPDDVNALTTAVEALVDDPERRRSLGESGRSWVEHWMSPDSVAAAYEDLFERLIRHRA